MPGSWHRADSGFQGGSQPGSSLCRLHWLQLRPGSGSHQDLRVLPFQGNSVSKLSPRPCGGKILFFPQAASGPGGTCPLSRLVDLVGGGKTSCFLTLNEHLHGQSLVPRRMWCLQDRQGEMVRVRTIYPCMSSFTCSSRAQSVGYKVLFLPAAACRAESDPGADWASLHRVSSSP